jgi:hypothetical protein
MYERFATAITNHATPTAAHTATATTATATTATGSGSGTGSGGGSGIAVSADGGTELFAGEKRCVVHEQLFSALYYSKNEVTGFFLFDFHAIDSFVVF